MKLEKYRVRPERDCRPYFVETNPAFAGDHAGGRVTPTILSEGYAELV
jgi:hypothetical protein